MTDFKTKKIKEGREYLERLLLLAYSIPEQMTTAQAEIQIKKLADAFISQFLLQAIEEAEQEEGKKIINEIIVMGGEGIYSGLFVDRQDWENYKKYYLSLPDKKEQTGKWHTKNHINCAGCAITGRQKVQEEKKECECIYPQAVMYHKGFCKYRDQKEGGEGSTGKIYGEYGNPKPKEIWEIWEKGKK